MTATTAADTARTHPADLQAIVLSRMIENGERVFVGVNSPVPMVAALMATATHAPDAQLVTIAGGINPRPTRHTPATSSPAYAEGTAAVLDNLAFYDLVARGGIDFTFLGGAQIDRRGRVNSSFLGAQDRPDTRFPGGGGAAFILPLAKRVVIWRASHDPRIFVEECEFVTATGNLRAVVTPLCVFAVDTDGLRVDTVHAGVDEHDLRDRTGFDLGPGRFDTTPVPSEAELAALAEADPDGIRFSEFKS